MRAIAIPCLFVLLALCAGCQRQRTAPEPYTTLAEPPGRQTQVARDLNVQAQQALADGDLEGARAKLQAALAADILFAPAHNNLGLVYYRQGQYYLAAWEFQYAAKLMPHDPRPRNNLGLVFEAVGQLPRAAGYYDEALALAPDDPQLIGNLARVYARQGTQPERLRELLTELVLKDDRPAWVAWAREQLALVGGPVPLEAPAASDAPAALDAAAAPEP